MLEELVFGPGIDTVKDDALLAGRDEVFDLGNDLADDPVGAFGLTNLFAEVFLVFGVDFDTAFLHFFENHAAKVDFGVAEIGEVVDGDRFAAATHADDGDDFYVFGIKCHSFTKIKVNLERKVDLKLIMR